MSIWGKFSDEEMESAAVAADDEVYKLIDADELPADMSSVQFIIEVRAASFWRRRPSVRVWTRSGGWHWLAKFRTIEHAQAYAGMVSEAMHDKMNEAVDA
jgi:hypothetical protein